MLGGLLLGYAYCLNAHWAAFLLVKSESTFNYLCLNLELNRICNKCISKVSPLAPLAEDGVNRYNRLMKYTEMDNLMSFFRGIC